MKRVCVDPFFGLLGEPAKDFIFFGVGAGSRNRKPHGSHGQGDHRLAMVVVGTTTYLLSQEQ